MINKFFPAIRTQTTGHCGPTAMALCITVLTGKLVKPRDVCKAAGNRLSGFRTGLDEEELKTAARKYGIEADLQLFDAKRKAITFLSEIVGHLMFNPNTGPVIVLVDDFSHWITILGYNHGKYLIRDSLEEERPFNSWHMNTLLRRAWNENEEGDTEPSQYFAIHTYRKDGKGPAIEITPEFIRKCKEGHK